LWMFSSFSVLAHSPPSRQFQWPKCHAPGPFALEGMPVTASTGLSRVSHRWLCGAGGVSLKSVSSRMRFRDIYGLRHWKGD
jgi:hypothetical protein